MKRQIALVVLSLATVSGTAHAADMAVWPRPAQALGAPAPYAVPAFSWTGCYIGGVAGFAWGQSKQTAATSAIPADAGLPITNSFNVNGGMAGGTVGCNYQAGAFVGGIENDAAWTNLRGSANDIPPFAPGAVSHTTMGWIDTLRGRLGVAFDRVYVYGTGGAAFADVGVNVCNPAGVCSAASDTRTGWTVGGGIEWAAWNVPDGTVTLKAEYLHVDLGNNVVTPPTFIGAAGPFDARNVRLTDDIVRAGINWKFKPWPYGR